MFGDPDTNISDEYFAYKRMADKYGITDIKYMSDTGGMHRMYCIAPVGHDGDNAPLSEWKTIPALNYSDIASAKTRCKV